jgi:ABC-2 type transport system permease protein
VRNVLTILRREVGSFLLSPVAWVVLTAFYVAFGARFTQVLVNADMVDTFYFMSLVMAFAVPLLTMRQIAEERKSGRMELLATAPVTDVQLVLGKFLGAFVFYVFLLVPTAVYVWILYYFSTVGPDWWMLVSGYVGILLMGTFMLSFGLFVSSISREQIIAGAVSANTLFLMWLLGELLRPAPPGTAAPGFWPQVHVVLSHVGSFLAFNRHLMPFLRGVMDTREIVFFASFTVFFLFLAVATVSARKWR